MKDNQWSITVPGTKFEIRPNTLYKVENKTDHSAPDGFKEVGTTKLPTPRVSTIAGCPWDGDRSVWDTGFYEESKCLIGMSDAEKAQFVRDVQEYLVKPFEKTRGVGKLSHLEENDFFDNFRIPLNTAQTFNTGDKEQTLQLYLAVLGKNLAPKEMESNPAFKSAQYTVVDKESAVNKRQQIEYTKDRAIGAFHGMLQNQKDNLIKFLEYSNILSHKVNDDMALNSVFKRHIDDKEQGHQNAKIFLDKLDMIATDEGKDTLYIYSEVKKAVERDKIFKSRGIFYLRNPEGESIELGGSIKQATDNIVSDKKLMQQFIEITEEINQEELQAEN